MKFGRVICNKDRYSFKKSTYRQCFDLSTESLTFSRNFNLFFVLDKQKHCKIGTKERFYHNESIAINICMYNSSIGKDDK